MKTTFRNNGSRHPSVVSFSREHHFGLVFCRHMSRLVAAKSNIEHIRLLFHLFWENELRNHTHAEEQFIKTLHMVPAIRQVESDHLRLEIMFMECQYYSYEELQCLIKALEGHIRFEEKFLFPRVTELFLPAVAV